MTRRIIIFVVFFCVALGGFYLSERYFFKIASDARLNREATQQQSTE